MPDVDLSLWSFWWEFNKDPYLALKAHVHADQARSGGEGWFLGLGSERVHESTLKPSELEIRTKVVPALLGALASEKNNDIVTGCLIALAKIGDPPLESSQSPSAEVIRGFLADKNQEIAETAALALGILAHRDSVPYLVALLEAGAAGRALVGAGDVTYRTRAFAAYGLGLIGARTAHEEVRRTVVGALARSLGSPDSSRRDIKVACIVSLGLVPLETVGSPRARVEVAGTGPSTRCEQLELLLGFLADEEHNHLVRAHCGTALARLLRDLPAPVEDEYAERVSAALLALLTQKRVQPELEQSAVQALGALAPRLGETAAAEVRRALVQAGRSARDGQARLFAWIALAHSARPDAADAWNAGEEARKELLEQLSKGKGNTRSWAGLACGVLARQTIDAARVDEGVLALRQAVRIAFDEEKDPQLQGAFAIALGIMGDVEAASRLIERLERVRSDELRGYISLGLGLMGSSAAQAPIQRILADSKYRPELLKQAAIALGLLGDKQVVPQLLEQLRESRGLAAQAAVATALGFIGDRRSLDPLVGLLQNQDVSASARGFAAAALGIVGDKEPLPWNSKIGVGLNYRAATETLTSPMGTGILDIL